MVGRVYIKGSWDNFEFNKARRGEGIKKNSFFSGRSVTLRGKNENVKVNHSSLVNELNRRLAKAPKQGEKTFTPLKKGFLGIFGGSSLARIEEAFKYIDAADNGKKEATEPFDPTKLPLEDHQALFSLFGKDSTINHLKAKVLDEVIDLKNNPEKITHPVWVKPSKESPHVFAIPATHENGSRGVCLAKREDDGSWKLWVQYKPVSTSVTSDETVEDLDHPWLKPEDKKILSDLFKDSKINPLNVKLHEPIEVDLYAGDSKSAPLPSWVKQEDDSYRLYLPLKVMDEGRPVDAVFYVDRDERSGHVGEWTCYFFGGGWDDKANIKGVLDSAPNKPYTAPDGNQFYLNY